MITPTQMQLVSIYNGHQGSRVQAAILHDKIAELIATANHKGLHLTRASELRQIEEVPTWLS